jgi:hypothetical protein
MQLVLSATWNQFMTSSCHWKVFALFKYVIIFLLFVETRTQIHCDYLAVLVAETQA